MSLRGLPKGKYKVVDYVHNTTLGTINGPSGELPVQFKRSLLLMASPAQ